MNRDEITVSYTRRDLRARRHRRRLLSDLLAFGFVVILFTAGLGLVGAPEWAVIGIAGSALAGAIWTLVRWL